MSSVFDNIFRVVNIDSRVLGNLKKIISMGKFSSYHFPSLFGWTLPLFLVDSCGVSPSSINVTVQRFFPALVGYYISDKDVDDLGIESLLHYCDEFDYYPSTRVEKVAFCLLVGKYLGYTNKSYFFEELRRDLVGNASYYISQLVDSLEKLRGKLKGINVNVGYLDFPTDSKAVSFLVLKDLVYNFLTRTMRDVVSWKYKGKYVLSVDEIKKGLNKYSELDSNVILLSKYSDFQYVEGEWVTLGCVMGSSVGSKGNVWVLGNKKMRALPQDCFFYIRDSRGSLTSPRFPVYSDQEITEETKFDFVLATHEEGYYYRDLFVHGKGPTGSYINFLALLDGRVFGSVCIAPPLGHSLEEDFESLNLVYACGKTSSRYKRLSKLVVLGVTTRGFLNVVCDSIPGWSFHPFSYLRSVSYSPYPEIKTDRGILTIKDRKKLSDGTYKIVYVSKWRDMSLQEALQYWIRKWGN